MREHYFRFRRLQIELIIFGVLAGSLALADQIDPIGEENLGYFKINLPPNPVNILWPSLTYVDGSSRLNGFLNPSEPYRVRETSNGVIGLNFRGSAVWLQKPIHVIKGKSTELNLSLFNAQWDNQKLATDVGPIASVNIHFFDTPIFNKPILPSGDLFNGNRAPFFSGDIRLSFFPSQLGSYTYSLKEGEDFTAQVALPETRSKITLISPQANFPDAMSNVACGDTFTYVALRSEVKAGKNNSFRFQLDKSPEIKVRYFPEDAPGNPLVYELVLSNISYSLTLKAGEEKRIEVKRIDVNDVLVTRENGTTYYVPGNYSIWRKAEDGQWVEISAWIQARTCGQGAQVRNFPTKTGLYVLSGEYKISVSYRTEETSVEQKKDFYLKI